MDVAICEVLMEEVVKLLLFCRGQGECPGVRELSPRCKVNGMVPCLLWWGSSKASLEKTSLKLWYWTGTISSRGWLSSAFWASWANHCDGVSIAPMYSSSHSGGMNAA